MSTKMKKCDCKKCSRNKVKNYKPFLTCSPYENPKTEFSLKYSKPTSYNLYQGYKVSCGDLKPQETYLKSSTHNPNYKYESCLYQMNNKNINYNGAGNNNLFPTHGLTDMALLRKCPATYSESNGLTIRSPTPRIISNNICKTSNGKKSLNSEGLTDMVWIWGQFIDHTISLTEQDALNPNQTENMVTPADDQFPNLTIPFVRSEFIFDSNPQNIRQHPNRVSAFIDAGTVYGFDHIRSLKIRRLDGSGKLKTLVADNNEEILPYNIYDLPNAHPTNPIKQNFFLAGDIRANENVSLIGIHTLFVREHNRLCDEVKSQYPEFVDQEIYMKARKMVIGFIQKITYDEFLPTILGKNVLKKYLRYDPKVDPSVAIEFSTVGYRIGHTMITGDLGFLNSENNVEILELRNSFFNPAYVQKNGVDSLIGAASKKLMANINPEISDDLRNFLFGNPQSNQMLLDLACLNIQRGRDHGIADYNTVRENYGLKRILEFSDISSNPEIVLKLRNTYPDVNSIDAWIGGISEDHVKDAQVGELFLNILKDQFERIRDGDRFWWESSDLLSGSEKVLVSKTKLSDIIRRNTKIQVNDNVFINSN